MDRQTKDGTEDILSSFSARFSELMDEREIGAKSLGEKIGHNFYDFYHWKSKKIKYMPKLCVLIKIADEFSCSLEFLLGLEETNTLPNPKTQLPPFSERFSAVLEKSGKTVTYIAREAKLSGTSVIYDWKNGKTCPRAYTLLAIARVLDCSLDYLVGREN